MGMPVRFGTDGIRGRASDEITPDLAYRLGRAVAAVFSVPIFVGYDTRESSPNLAAAVLAGLADGGAQGVNLGYFTTPGVAVIAQQRGGAGVVVSASHNPYYDNGLKVLGVRGGKLDHATEAAVESALNVAESPMASVFEARAIDETAQHDYVRHLRELAPADLSSLSIVVDCANGAASHVAHELYETTGAALTFIHDQPDGRNINVDSGSTHVEALVAAVRAGGADLGLAFDGDADRLIAVDSEGTVRDGDDLMVLFALDRFERGILGGGVAVTSMSNLGLTRALSAAHIEIEETDVGDRNVLLALEDRSWILGGEQSGHVIFRDLAPTGDGMLTGLILAELVVRRGPLADLAGSAWRRVPQSLFNVSRDHFSDDDVQKIFNELLEDYGVDRADVRLLVRPSGTEPLVRIMIEALNAEFVEVFSERLTSLYA
ncbi:MAG: phosphoglucosamine mutase [Acidimicrobiales bacterium]|jgi:phosphoglucosamine mutase